MEEVEVVHGWQQSLLIQPVIPNHSFRFAALLFGMTVIEIVQWFLKTTSRLANLLSTLDQ